MSGLIAISADLVTPQAFAIDTTAISNQVAEYAKLTISGIDDKEGLKAVRSARLELRNVRTSIEAKRKELKEGSLTFGRKVDAVAKELTGLVEPTEKLLDEQEKAIERQIEAIIAQKMAERETALRAVNAILPPMKLLESLSDPEFDLMLGNATKANAERLEREAEQARQEQMRRQQEEQARQAEQERLQKEREELEADRAKQREEQARIDEQRRQEQEEFRRRQEEAREALEIERREIRRLQEEQEEERRRVQEERDAIEAEKAERARKEREAIEAKERAEREERERQEEERRRVEAEQARIEEERLEAERIQREAEERQRIAELMRPVREKVDAFIDAVEAAACSVPVPDVGDPILQGELSAVMFRIVADLRAVADSHLGDA